MKVYFQRIDNTTCYYKNLEDLTNSLELEADEFSCDNQNISDNEISEMMDETIKKLNKLKLNQEIEQFGSHWGVSEMSEKEFNELEEFEGF